MSTSAALAAHPTGSRRDTVFALAGTAAIAALWAARHVPVPALRLADGWLLWITPRLVIEAIARFAAARRADLPRRLRLSFGMLGAICAFSALSTAWAAVSWTPGFPEEPTAVQIGWYELSYLLTIPAVLLLPMAPFRRGQVPMFLLDLAVSVGGIVAVGWILRVSSIVTANPREWFADPAVYGLVGSAATLVALNLVTIRRRTIPSPRAFWLAVAGLAAYLPAVVLVCVAAGSPAAGWWIDFFYFAGVIPTIWSAWATRRDPIRPDADGRPHWLWNFNPFALASPALVSTAMIITIVRGPDAAEPPLAITLVVITALLVVRLVLTTRENDHGLRELAEREAREQRERLEALRRIAGGVAHEFSNSLTVMLGHAAIGAEAAESADAREAFETIRSTAQHSANLTRHLLWFTGRQFQQRQRFALDAWLDEVAPDLRAEAGEAVQLEVSAHTGGAQLDADRRQLHDVLVELVRNAREAMPGGGRIAVVAARANGAGREGGPDGARPLEIAVRDHGSGIAAEHLPHVFEPFFSSRDLSESPGLGLAIVHGVVTAHGGTVAVRSAPGAGTEVVLRLPEA